MSTDSSTPDLEDNVQAERDEEITTPSPDETPQQTTATAEAADADAQPGRTHRAINVRRPTVPYSQRRGKVLQRRSQLFHSLQDRWRASGTGTDRRNETERERSRHSKSGVKVTGSYMSVAEWWSAEILLVLHFGRTFLPHGSRISAAKTLVNLLLPRARLRRTHHQRAARLNAALSTVRSPTLQELRDASALLTKWSDAALESLIEKFQPCYYFDNEPLIYRGEMSIRSFVFLVLSGTVRLWSGVLPPAGFLSIEDSSIHPSGQDLAELVGAFSPSGPSRQMENITTLVGSAKYSRRVAISSVSPNSNLLSPSQTKLFIKGRCFGEYAALMQTKHHECYSAYRGDVLCYRVNVETFLQLYGSLPWSIRTEMHGLTNAVYRARIPQESKPTIMELRRSHQFFSQLNDEALRQVITSLGSGVAPPGETLIRNVPRSQRVFYILSGTVVIGIRGKMFREVTAGGAIGTEAIALMHPSAAEVSAVSRSFVEYWSVDRNAVLAAITECRLREKLATYATNTVQPTVPATGTEVFRRTAALVFIPHPIALRVSHALRVRVVLPDSTLQRQGEVVKDAIVVVAGVLLLTTNETVREQGRGRRTVRVVHDELSVGSVFGFTELLAVAPSPFSVDVPHSAVVKMIGRSEFFAAFGVQDTAQEMQINPSSSVLVAVVERACAIIAERCQATMTTVAAESGELADEGAAVNEFLHSAQRIETARRACASRVRKVRTHLKQLERERRTNELEEEARLHEEMLHRQRRLHQLSIEKKIFASLKKQLNFDKPKNAHVLAKQDYFDCPARLVSPTFAPEDVLETKSTRYKWGLREDSPPALWTTDDASGQTSSGDNVTNTQTIGTQIAVNDESIHFGASEIESQRSECFDPQSQFFTIDPSGALVFTNDALMEEMNASIESPEEEWTDEPSTPRGEEVQPISAPILLPQLMLPPNEHKVHAAILFQNAKDADRYFLNTHRHQVHQHFISSSHGHHTVSLRHPDEPTKLPPVPPPPELALPLHVVRSTLNEIYSRPPAKSARTLRVSKTSEQGQLKCAARYGNAHRPTRGRRIPLHGLSERLPSVRAGRTIQDLQPIPKT